MRNIYKYELKKGNKLVYVGITNSPERRKNEHLLEGKDFDKMNLVGRVSTLKGAFEWETDRFDQRNEADHKEKQCRQRANQKVFKGF